MLASSTVLSRKSTRVEYIEPSLYYWQRNKPDATAEIDYIIPHGDMLIPIEVIAGSAGTLKSLHYFMELKKLTTAVRINADAPSLTPVDIKSPNKENIQYQLLSIPFYLCGQLHRLLDSLSIF